MSRIAQKTAQLKQKRKKALVTYLTAGFPDEQTTRELIPELSRSGADFIELGMPFSDPVADGPVIQQASEAALRQGMTVSRFLRLCADVRPLTEVPLVMMTYYNPVFAYGISRFAEQAAQAGLDGLIVPDLPPEESAPLRRELRSRNIDLIFLVSPLTSPDRMRRIAKYATGFIYYVSLTGVTGAQLPDPREIAGPVTQLRQITSLPVFVGFGISTPPQVRAIGTSADGVIVGSALVRLLGPGRKKQRIRDVAELVRRLAAQC